MIGTRKLRNVRTFATYREALTNYAPPPNGRGTRFLVTTPPTEEDFFTHGHFHRGEVTIEYSRICQQWGGAFGADSFIATSWDTPMEVHNHPNRIINPSPHDLSVLKKWRQEIVSTPRGVARVHRLYFERRFACWPEKIESPLLARTRLNGVLELPKFIRHHRGQRAEDHVRQILTAGRRTTRSVKTVDPPLTGSFFTSAQPIAYAPGKLVIGEVAFIAWEDFPALFRYFGNAFNLLSPDHSWGGFFGLV